MVNARWGEGEKEAATIVIRTTRQARHERRAHKTYDAAAESREGESEGGEWEMEQFHTNMDNNCPGQDSDGNWQVNTSDVCQQMALPLAANPTSYDMGFGFLQL